MMTAASIRSKGVMSDRQGRRSHRATTIDHDQTFVGISCDYHDAAAAVVRSGRILAAAQEERFSRSKHDPELPIAAARWCLDSAGVGAGEPVLAAVHGKPMTTYERILRSHARAGPRGFGNLFAALRSWTGRKLWIGYRVETMLRAAGVGRVELVYVEHHLAHAASAFYPSPFDSAAVVTIDGVGEWATTSIAHGRGSRLGPLAEIRYPHSLGLLYSAVTAHCGFAVNDGESKLMGLAPYGSPRFAKALRSELIELRDDGSFRLDPRWFRFEAGPRMFSPDVDRILGPPRRPKDPLTEREADLAASIQLVLEDAVLNLLGAVHDRTRESRLCLAGGVALNCVMNERIHSESPFDDLWVQPAAGDAGGAIGAPLWAAHVLKGLPREVSPDAMSGAALGPTFDDTEIESWLQGEGVTYRRCRDLAEVSSLAATAIDGGAIVGWFEGAMEFGPRALGHRSILADPRRADMVARINAKVKGREGFRPLAPAVLADHAADLFDMTGESPFMLLTAPVRGAVLPNIEPVHGAIDFSGLLGSVSSRIPACTHVDGSARVQTVHADRSPNFHRLLSAFYRRTGCPVLLNTSFNLGDEPIVCTPADALSTAVRGRLDLLVLGTCVVSETELSRLAAIATPVHEAVAS